MANLNILPNPESSRANVQVRSNEFINAPTINRCVSKLLTNDVALEAVAGKFSLHSTDDTPGFFTEKIQFGVGIVSSEDELNGVKILTLSADVGQLTETGDVIIQGCVLSTPTTAGKLAEVVNSTTIKSSTVSTTDVQNVVTSYQSVSADIQNVIDSYTIPSTIENICRVSKVPVNVSIEEQFTVPLYGTNVADNLVIQGKLIDGAKTFVHGGSCSGNYLSPYSNYTGTNITVYHPTNVIGHKDNEFENTMVSYSVLSYELDNDQMYSGAVSLNSTTSSEIICNTWPPRITTCEIEFNDGVRDCVIPMLGNPISSDFRITNMQNTDIGAMVEMKCGNNISAYNGNSLSAKTVNCTVKCIGTDDDNGIIAPSYVYPSQTLDSNLYTFSTFGELDTTYYHKTKKVLYHGFNSIPKYISVYVSNSSETVVIPVLGNHFTNGIFISNVDESSITIEWSGMPNVTGLETKCKLLVMAWR